MHAIGDTWVSAEYCKIYINNPASFQMYHYKAGVLYIKVTRSINILDNFLEQSNNWNGMEKERAKTVKNKQ